MSAADEILAHVVAWARKEPNIRSLILVGSRASRQPPDDLADIDIQVYAGRSEPYTRDRTWLSEIGQMWLCVHDEYSDGEIRVPTRLVIFAGGVKADFAFYPAGSLSNGVRAGLTHQVLLEKDGTAREPRARPVCPDQAARPTEAEFVRIVQEFWFEAYHVAKYLARNELWLAKERDWATKELLQKVIEWQGRTAHDPDEKLQRAGRPMRSWVGEEVWEGLHRSFARFDREDSWGALVATAGLFRRLATETASKLGFVYPADVDRNITKFILGLRASTLDRSG